MKKGQALSINVIIIAILAILVLVILGVIFTGRAGIFAKETARGCIPNGGLCVAPDRMASNCDPVDYVQKAEYDCPGTASTCCVPRIVAERG